MIAKIINFLLQSFSNSYRLFSCGSLLEKNWSCTDFGGAKQLENASERDGAGRDPVYFKGKVVENDALGHSDTNEVIEIEFRFCRIGH